MSSRHIALGKDARLTWVLATLVASVLITSCSGGNESSLPLTFSSSRVQGHVGEMTRSPIKHIVFIVQEGRTFENLFAGWPNADAPLEGRSHTGQVVTLQGMHYKEDRLINSSFKSAKFVWHGGQLNFFDANTFANAENGPPVGRFVYAYLDKEDAAPYHWIAQHYVLTDHMFQTEFGASFTGHLDLVGGSTFITPSRAVAGDPSHVPWGCDAPKGTRVPVEGGGNALPWKEWVSPCFSDIPTIVDLLDQAGLPWKYYVSSPKQDVSGLTWSIFDSIKRVRYGPDWTQDIKSPVTSVLQDAADGNLPAVSWVIPKAAWSDDPSQKSDEGPSWVAAVVNAVGKGPDWNSSAVVVIWSHWGGWFDSAPGELPSNLALSGYGFRVPCLIISPYAKRGVVSHREYNFGSLLRFVEDTFALPTLRSTGKGFVYTDDVSASIGDALNVRQRPRRFAPVPAKYPARHFLPQ